MSRVHTETFRTRVPKTQLPIFQGSKILIFLSKSEGDRSAEFVKIVVKINA
jgi:hypothetical protein